MGHLRESMRKKPECMVRLYAEVARQFSVSPLHHKDRFNHWEDDEVGNPPVETVTSFTLRFGPFLSATIETAAPWPEGEPESIEIKLWLHRPESPSWFALITPSLRHQLEALGFRRLGQWYATWPASDASVEGIGSQLQHFGGLPIRIIREVDLPGELPWPGHSLGADVAAADMIALERTETKDGRTLHHIDLAVGGPPHAVVVDDSGLAYIRWWEMQDPSSVGVAASSPLTPERLVAELRSAPEPLVDLAEDPRWLMIGAVRVSKVSARLDVGFPYPLLDATHFEARRFEVDDRRGWAIILVAAGALPDVFAGWVPESRREQAEAWVERLNREILARIAQANRAVEKGDVAQTLLYVQGSEYAPDDPIGMEILELRRSGELVYERRRAGKTLRALTGDVDAKQVLRLHDALTTTSFPAPPQKSFPPGASMCFLITDPPYRRMPIRRDIGLKMAGYGSILLALTGLCDALRESRRDELSPWSFVEATVSATEKHS